MKNKPSLFATPCNILVLLPHSDNAALVNKHQKLDDLYLIRSVVDFSTRALELFITGNLLAFDPQVGENLCQIRAYKIIHLSKQWLCSTKRIAELLQEIERFKSYKHTIEKVINEWENALKQVATYSNSLDAVEKTSQFLSRHQLLFPLHEELAFIIACYFLTHFSIRKDNIPIAVNLEHIVREFHISKYRAKRLTHRYQQLICELGCEFILKIAQELPIQLGYADILPKLCQIADENRMVLPCYPVSEIIFYHSIQQKIPVLLIVKRINQSSAIHSDLVYFLLLGQEESTDYDLVSCNPYLAEHCLIVTGEMLHDNHESIRHYIHRVLRENPLKIILANTASHPQYSGKRLEALRSDPFSLIPNNALMTRHARNLTHLRFFALEAGCSKEKQTLFFLRHIYVNKLKDEITQLHTQYPGEAFEAHAMLHP